MNLTFGSFLKQLRKRAGMTQHDLAAATGYSRTLIGALEQNMRLPDVQVILQSYLPALGLQDEPHLAKQLVELAALARGERPPSDPPSTEQPRWESATAATEEIAHLPNPPTALIGREQEISYLCRRLLGHQGHLLTLIGPPGIGKTRLALAVAAQLQPHYRDGVLFVSLAAIGDAATMVSAILAAAGSRSVGPQPPQTHLVELLRRKSLLLVLDNFEQLLAPALADEAVRLVAALVTECPRLMVLTTSRERLHLRSEQCYKVPPLALSAALDLFVQRAHAVNGKFSLSTHNRPTVEAICERLDRLPLAIELCAWQIELFSPAQLLAQLQSRPLDLLADGARDLPPQQRTLRSAIQHSYALLSDEERTLFRTLGIFVGGFALPEVEAVMIGEVTPEARKLNDDGTPQSLLTHLRSLVNKSLVYSETTPAGEQRFLLLEMLREFALAQLQFHGETTALRQRHYLVYRHLFRTGDSYLRRPESMGWLARLAPEQDNLRTALAWSYGEKQYTDAAWLVMAIGYFWFLVGQRYETARWLKQLLPHRQTFPADLRLGILIVVANAVPPEARIVYTNEMVQLLENCSNPLLQAAAWGSIAAALPDATKAAALERAIALSRMGDESTADPAFSAATDRDFLLSTHLMSYAMLQLNRGEFDQATALATEALLLNRHQENHYGNSSAIGNSLALLGCIAFLKGDLPDAHRYFQEIITIAATFNYPTIRCEWQPLLGLVTLYLGDAVEAQQILCESVAFCLEQQEKFFLARNYTYLTETALATGAFVQAEQWLAQSLAAHVESHQITVDEVERLLIAARLATAQQQYQRAATLFGLAEQMHNHIPVMIAKPMRTLADAALATVREALEPALFAEAFAAGQPMSLEEGYTTVLAPNTDVDSRNAPQ
jgi:predicted ATPase/transcriptional regulator with XRE-family HTH domain